MPGGRLEGVGAGVSAGSGSGAGAGAGDEILPPCKRNQPSRRIFKDPVVFIVTTIS